MAAGAAVVPAALVTPLISTLFFVCAALVALVAWLLKQPSEQSALTYWDVAGALTLCGIVTAALIDPDQLVRLATGRDQ